MAEDIPSRIEHTVLGPATTPSDVRALLDEAIEYGLRACVPSSYVDLADDYAPGVPVAAVVGFPHGTASTGAKVREAELAAGAGADELDMVCHVGRVRAGDDSAVTRDIRAVVEATPLPVKVIVAAPLLDDDEKRRACGCAADAGADFVKTATGFAGGGATTADVELLAEYLPVKASGGIGSWSEAEAMFEAGATRIGASSGATIAREHPGSSG